VERYAVKNSVKALLGAASASRLLRPVVARQLRTRTNVVYYHYVGRSTPYYSAFYGGCTFDRLRRDIEELAEVFQFASLEQVCEERSGAQRGSDRPSLAVTFDDGFRVNQPQVLELFDKHQIKATTFLTTGCVDNRSLMWRHKLSAILHLATGDLVVSAYNPIAARYRLPAIKSHNQLLEASRQWSMSAKDDLADQLWMACELPPLDEFLAEHRPYFTWKELHEWRSAGHGIGLHSLTHPFCSRLDDRGINQEIVEPARELRERFDLTLMPFSYPFGDRLAPERERALLDEGVFDYAFGIAGFASKDAAPQSLERAGLEAEGVAWPVFGRTLTSRARRFL
jgi:peptidoglycan/xylan/chitin deacetylase (PgdA/CDA1 family)